jgi:type I restriction enzyme R subunit
MSRKPIRPLLPRLQHYQYNDLATNPVFSSRDMKAVPERYREIVPGYIKDYVSLNQFAS